MISGRLTMRAVVERNIEAATDPYGHPLPPDFQPHGTFRCFAWSNQSRELVESEKTAMVEDMRAMFALGTDITENDEITAITDRAGTVIIPGRLRVEGKPQRKHTHLEVALKRIA
ncbi:hypothetical protein [Pelagibacterium halotolerans]|uniref:Phage protein n=1 Tax=Pelagibacterium halotolerans (strain DSM 22347 / JCM 15775 / CGMCC 1.7692 / B2) TaxID=1082931 RepID=G4RDC8_PELHB|nr:hypothetical protein [Pelagibacterium halotolerans]AEQ50754.1 hypothetical protein KKY_715 [Pelagibacterium halotolerans B2]QJR19326.1 hypothetical protein HKM20_13285 [Pelagibacterium halotolerans]SDZ94919.1 hypothetical protein SAMN05428936_101641 [Pelagibacterium halotolerans]